MKSLIIVCLLLLFPSTSFAFNDRDVRRLEGYAAVIGRAGACGLVLTDETARVGAWIDMKFGHQAQEYLDVFLQTVAENAQMQRAGETTEPCPRVKQIVGQIIWP